MRKQNFAHFNFDSNSNLRPYRAVLFMRIAVNTRFLLKDQLEGIGWYTYELLKCMVEQQPNDEFIFFFDRPYSDQYVFAKNVTPVVLFPQARHPFLWHWWFEWSIASALKKHKADVFLSPDGYASLSTSVKTVMVTHDIAHVHYPQQIAFLTRKYYQQMVPRFLKHAQKVVTVSKFTRNDILAAYPVDPEKVVAVYNGCRKEFQVIDAIEKALIQEKYAEGQEYFFYVGAVHPRKNVHRLISAFDQFKSNTKSKKKLLIGGRFAWKTGEVKLAYDNAIHQEDILFLGYLKNEEVPRLMGAAYALTYVSLFEGFGLPLVEAMNCGVPFITSNCSSMPEVAGDAGMLVSPESLSEITQALERIESDKALYQQLVYNGKKQKLAFSWKVAAKRVYALMYDLVQH